MASRTNRGTGPQFVKLIMVTSENNNKFYEMSWDGISPNFTVKYGRVESTAVTGSYSISDWDKKYNEKVKKGYKDVTHTVAVKEAKTPTQAVISKTGDSLVDSFLDKMKAYTDNLVAKTYSVKYTNVTESQVLEAQSYLDDLNNLASKKSRNTKDINDKLLELYTVIPRYMGNVKDYLVPAINLDRILEQEQDNLDAMESQVKMYKKGTKKKTTKKDENLLEILGITMKESKSTKDIDYLLKQVPGTSRKVKAVFEVVKSAEDKVFDGWLKNQGNKDTKTLIHGTRCTSVIPILEIGLKIRPKGNFQFSGKVYGDGNYFSEVVQKSLGYTGYDEDSILLIYEVHTGNPYVYDGWYKGNSFSLNYTELQKRGFDSTYVKAGNGLLNSEIIAYREEQCRIRKIIWLKN